MELALAMFIVFIATSFLMSLFVAGNRAFVRQGENSTRISLAQAKMDEVMAVPYTSSARILGLAGSGTFPAPFDKYSWVVAVSSDFNGDPDVNRVTVDVTSPNGARTTLQGLRSRPPSTIAPGEALYEAWGCVGCHGLYYASNPAMSVPGSTAIIAPSHNMIGDRGSPVAGLTTVEYIKQSVRDPSAYVVPGYSPYMAGLPLTTMPDADLDVLAQWLVDVTTTPPPPPPPPPPPTTGGSTTGTTTGGTTTGGTTGTTTTGGSTTSGTTTATATPCVDLGGCAPAGIVY